jgi:hypothetical protein
MDTLKHMVAKWWCGDEPLDMLIGGILIVFRDARPGQSCRAYYGQLRSVGCHPDLANALIERYTVKDAWREEVGR